MDRRTFVKVVGAIGAMGLTGRAIAIDISTSTSPGSSAEKGTPAQGLRLRTSAGELKGDMLYRELGRTGVKVSAIAMGGFHLGKASLKESDAIRLVQDGVDRGITFMDNAWDYNEGQSELRMGKALEGGRRDKVFLMTKIDGRTKETAAQQIDESLKRLRTDHVDMMMHHEVLRFEDADRIFAEGGAQEAMLEAQKAGKIRFIGFTGHKDPRVHLYMLEVGAKHDFTPDAVLMPVNVFDAHFRSFAQLVGPELASRNIGMLSMKPFAGGDGVILKTNTATPIECLHYALNISTTVITGIDKPEILEQAFEAAKTFKLMDVAQIDAMLAKTKEVAMTGKYELFKTSSHFDSTAMHPEWLGGDTPAVEKLVPKGA